MTTLAAARKYYGIALSDDDSYIIPATLGSELISNGNFGGSSAGWSVSSGWTFSFGGNYMQCPASQANVSLYQTQFITAGDYYEVQFDVGSISGSNWTLQFTCAGYTHKAISGTVASEGARTYKFVFQAVNGGGFMSSTGFNFNAWTDGSTAFYVDNASMKHLDTTSTMISQWVDGDVFPRASGFTNYTDDQSIWWVG